MAFSIMCMFLTVMYAGFAALTFSFSHSILEEHSHDEREEMPQHQMHKMTLHSHCSNAGYDGTGYIGERFDVHRSRQTTPGVVGSFVAPKPADVATLT